jgi:hypothetical protein
MQKYISYLITFSFLFHCCIALDKLDLQNPKVIFQSNGFIPFSKDGAINCTDCIPSVIRINSNGKIFVSFPRYNKNSTHPTFTKFNDTSTYFEKWPTKESNMSSVNGFEIDDNNNIFILDQGNKELYIFTDKGDLLGSIDLSPHTLNDSNSNTILHDIVLEPTRGLAFISTTNSYSVIENADDSKIKSQLIIVNYTLPTESNKKVESSIKVFKNETFAPDKSYWLHINDVPVNTTNPENITKPVLIGLSNLAISCSFDYLYFSPLTSDKIYSIKVDDLYPLSTDITINENYKGFASSSILMSGNGHLYLADLTTSLIKQYKQLSNLDEMIYKNINPLHSQNDTQSNWPSSIALYKNSLYYITNNFHLFEANNIVNVKLFNITIDNDEKRYVEGCSYDNFTTSYQNIILWIVFSILILVVLSFVLINSQKQDESTEKSDIDSFID